MFLLINIFVFCFLFKQFEAIVSVYVGYLDKFVAVCEEFSGRLIHESLINYYDFYNAHAL